MATPADTLRRPTLATDRYVVLLRGVNVGRAKRVAMADFSALLTDLGYGAVRTLLNSGNAVFTGPAGQAAAHGTRVQQALHQRLGVDAATLVKSGAQWSAVCAHNPLAGDCTDPARLLVALAPDAGTLAGLAPLAALVAAPERFHLGADAAYLWCPAGILACRAAEALVGKPGRAVTSRNWATVLKLQALLQALPG